MKLPACVVCGERAAAKLSQRQILPANFRPNDATLCDFCWDALNYKPDPKEYYTEIKPVVQRILASAGRVLTLIEIAEQLNEAGHATLQGKPFTTSAVNGMLRRLKLERGRRETQASPSVPAPLPILADREEEEEHSFVSILRGEP